MLPPMLSPPALTGVTPASTFIQMEPTPGAPATEKTEVWIAFDEANLYLTVRCWDSRPPSGWVMDEMRRDSGNVRQGDSVVLVTARAVVVLDENNTVLHSQLVAEIADEPDYDAALKVL